MLKYGKISKVNTDKAMVKVNLLEDDIETDWLQVLQVGTKANKFYAMFKTGDPVAVMLDNGGRGVVLGGLYGEAHLPNGDLKGPDVFGVLFSDGTRFKYDGSNFVIDMPLGKKLTINGDVEINGDLEHTGDLDIQGSISATGDVQAGPSGVSLLLHIHTGVTTGGGVSGPPQP